MEGPSNKSALFEKNLLLGDPFCGVPCEFQSTAAAFLGGPNMSPQHEIRLQGSREPLALHQLFPEGNSVCRIVLNGHQEKMLISGLLPNLATKRWSGAARSLGRLPQKVIGEIKEYDVFRFCFI